MSTISQEHSEDRRQPQSECVADYLTEQSGLCDNTRAM